MIPIDKLIRSRRRTIGMIIMPDGTLIVRAPLRTSMRTIQKTIESNAGWISKHRQKVRENAQKWPSHKYLPGEKFLYLGDEYELVFVRNVDKPLTFNGNQFNLDAKYADLARELLRKWYKKEALRILNERIKLYARQMGIDYSNLKITGAERRWGSCSPAGNICFSFRLIMAPLAVIDYVVVHELVHIQEKNHSSRFYDKVKSIIPNYKEQRRWLRKNQRHLSL
jgi:predicted metal-dependent hydrolase